MQIAKERLLQERKVSYYFELNFRIGEKSTRSVSLLVLSLVKMVRHKTCFGGSAKFLERPT